MVSFWWIIVTAVVFTFIGWLLCALCISSDESENLQNESKYIKHK